MLALTGRPARPTIAELKAKHGPNWGLTGIDPVLAAPGQVPGQVPGQEPGRDREAISARRAAREREANQRSMLAEYAARGFEPVLDAGGNVMSCGLIAAINPGLLRPAGQSQPAKRKRGRRHTAWRRRSGISDRDPYARDEPASRRAPPPRAAAVNDGAVE